ncbi:MAG: hypothetical protein JSW40_04580, partial [Candidatus Omnitrophota bacterium]
RKPQKKKILAWADILELDNKTKDDLLISAGYAPSYGQNLIKLSRRGLLEEAYFQKEYNFSEIWIVADRFLELDRHIYDSVKEKIREGKHYVYFQKTIYDFQTLLNQFKEDQLDISKVANNIECIIAPPTLFFSRFAIYDPGTKKMLGRIEHNTGELWDMNKEAAEKIYDVLSPIYTLLKRKNRVSTSCGDFMKFFPEI